MASDSTLFPFKLNFEIQVHRTSRKSPRHFGRNNRDAAALSTTRKTSVLKSYFFLTSIAQALISAPRQLSGPTRRPSWLYS